MVAVWRKRRTTFHGARHKNANRIKNRYVERGDQKQTEIWTLDAIEHSGVVGGHEVHDKRRNDKTNKQTTGIAHEDLFVGREVVAQKGDEHPDEGDTDTKQRPFALHEKDHRKHTEIKGGQ